MEYNSENILIADSLEEVASAERAGYVAHAFCTAGSCEIVYNDAPMSFRKGDIMIVLFGNMVTAVRPASDFRVRVIYISVSYMETCTPHTSYGITGGLSLYRQPIMCLNEEEQHLCESDFDAIIRRMESPLTYFHGDMMMAVTQTLFIDLYEFHARQNGKQIHVGEAAYHYMVDGKADGYKTVVAPNPVPENKQLLIIPGATHCDLYDGGEGNYIPWDTLAEFFNKNLK